MKVLWPDLPDIFIWSILSYFTLSFGHLVLEEVHTLTEFEDFGTFVGHSQKRRGQRICGEIYFQINKCESFNSTLSC
jgi:hypothetical protein